MTGPIGFVVLVLIAVRWLAQLGLEQLNQNHSRQQAQTGSGDHQRTVAYTVAKSRLHQMEVTADMVFLTLILVTGAIPQFFHEMVRAENASAWKGASAMVLVLVVMTLPDLAFGWRRQFGIEEKFGFNTMSRRLWLMDRVKGLVLVAAVGIPLLACLLYWMQKSPDKWWLWVWLSLLGCQVLAMVIAPVLILPLFNRFEALPVGSLRDRLLALAARTGFRAGSIQVMDGSKRSRHSNAFFTGFGRFRKIVLFDTLVEQLSESELEAVLAHEIGHYRLRHVAKMLAGSSLGLLAGLWFSWRIFQSEEFRGAFGLSPGDACAFLVLLSVLSGLVTFWMGPVMKWISRRFEFEADRFAVRTMGEAESMRGALRRLHEKNLSDPDPHPIYSRFYYSHPPLKERDGALVRGM